MGKQVVRAIGVTLALYENIEKVQKITKLPTIFAILKMPIFELPRLTLSTTTLYRCIQSEQ